MEHSNVSEGEEPEETYDTVEDLENTPPENTGTSENTDTSENTGIPDSTFSNEDKPINTPSFGVTWTGTTNDFNNADKGPPTVLIGGNTENGFEVFIK